MDKGLEKIQVTHIKGRMMDFRIDNITAYFRTESGENKIVVAGVEYPVVETPDMIDRLIKCHKTANNMTLNL